MHVGERFAAYLELDWILLQECSEQFRSNLETVWESFGSRFRGGLEHVVACCEHVWICLGTGWEHALRKFGQLQLFL